MNYTHKLSTIMIGALLVLMALSLVPLIPTVSAQSESLSYAVDTIAHGVIAQDREDYMNADGNPLHEDIANAVFQGPGVFGSPTVGYMKDIEINVTNYGTLTGMHYPYDEDKFLPVIEETPVGMADGVEYAPLEGWVVQYNLKVYPTTLPSDSGYLIVTYSGYKLGRIYPQVFGYDSDDDWEVIVNPSTWVNNPRLLVRYFNITLINRGSPYTPKFELDVIVIFNKATKFVEIFQNLKLIDINLEGCISVDFEMTLARMAILDANPYCDRAFYGWKNVTIEDPTFFMVLSWTNETLDKWVRHSELGYDYYGAYMIAYPVPDNWAIASTWYAINGSSVPAAAEVWSAPTLASEGFHRLAFLYMADIDGDGEGDGDQALIRVEWSESVEQVTPETLTSLQTNWKMIMYGVYDVGETYDGGEGGWFETGYVALHNGVAYNDGHTIPITDLPVLNPIDISTLGTWTHTGTLGWLNTGNTTLLHEDELKKEVIYLDIDQDGNKGAAEDDDLDKVTSSDEEYIEYSWMPTEELYWQLTFKFAPPVLCKIPECPACVHNIYDQEQYRYEYEGEPYDFLALPAPGATTDAAGGAYLNARFAAILVTFDVEAYNMTATVGYVNPATKELPYLMLRLESIPNVKETYSERRAHYLTEDGRALPQMEWMDRDTTWWNDVHYFVVTVAGIHPNLVTYYFNDFAPIVHAIGGDYMGSIVVLPTYGPIDITPYVGTEEGLGVIVLARDEFGNTALIVYGLDSQDTYWTAYYLVTNWVNIMSDLIDPCTTQGIVVEIDYSDYGNSWGDGNGIPTAHPTYPDISILTTTIEYGIVETPAAY